MRLRKREGKRGPDGGEEKEKEREDKMEVKKKRMKDVISYEILKMRRAEEEVDQVDCKAKRSKARQGKAR